MPKKLWKKGDPSPNPNGRPALPEDIRAASKLTAKEFIELGTKFMHMPVGQLAKIRDDEKSSAMERMLASIVHKAIDEGDQKRLDFLLDRLIGKVTQQYKLDMPNIPVVQQVVLKIPSNGKERAIDRDRDDPIES